MVYLSRIYTKTGDKGETALGDGRRVGKDDPRVVAYGTVDELNSVIGILVNELKASPEIDLLRAVQNDLFDVGADLCVPASPGETEGQKLRIVAEQVERLERAIDRINAGLKPLTSFVLPGGTPAAAWCHLARTTCRRAEREVVALSRKEPINPQVMIYLNRLSDLFFVLARAGNDQGALDTLWQPGKSQDKRAD